MSRVAVIDTNVVAGGLMTAQPDAPTAPTARILDGMLAARFPFALSAALLAEYRAVLNRPKLRERHGLAAEEFDAVLTELAQHAIVLTTRRGPVAPDPGDQHLWDLLAAHPDLCLVTGDRLLLAASQPPAPVFAPAVFIQGVQDAEGAGPS